MCTASRPPRPRWRAFPAVPTIPLQTKKNQSRIVQEAADEEAMALIVRGFIEPIAKELPLEYAVELNRLIDLEMEGSVG